MHIRPCFGLAGIIVKELALQLWAASHLLHASQLN